MCNSTISRPLYTDEDHSTQRGMLKSVPMDEVIQVDGLVKRFGNLTAVDGVSFTVNRGEIFGIVGPNGAGKTTTLEIIEGLQRATTGQVRVLGMDINSTPVAIKERIGVQLQASAYFDYLTLVEILDLFGSFYSTHIPPMELLEMVDLQDKANTVLKKLSGGQKQRFTVAASLVNDPELIILDEPSTGLDPAARHSLWDLIRGVRHWLGGTVNRSGVLRRILRGATVPIIAWLIFVVTIWVWHTPAVYNAALASEGVHALEHLTMFGAAVVFWWPVVGPAPIRSYLPYPMRFLYLFLALFQNIILGAILTFGDAPVYSHYENAPAHWGIDSAFDQQLGGILMWIPGAMMYFTAMAILFFAWLEQEERQSAKWQKAQEARRRYLAQMGAHTNLPDAGGPNA